MASVARNYPVDIGTCARYTTGTLLGTVIAGGFAVGIFLSYVPQQVTIFKRKTTEGLSPYYLFLMNLGSSLSFANVVVLSHPIFQCCQGTISVFHCISSLMGLLQIAAGLLGPVVSFTLAYYYRNGEHSNGEAIRKSATVAVVFNLVIWAIVLVVSTPAYLRPLATVFGLGAMSVGLVQYLPQIWTTYHLKHTGSLSMTTLAVQIPGGYIWSLSLAKRAGSHWSTWLSLFISATLQLILLGMAIYYYNYPAETVSGSDDPATASVSEGVDTQSLLAGGSGGQTGANPAATYANYHVINGDSTS